MGLYFSQIGKIFKFDNFQHSIMIRTVVNSVQKPISVVLPNALSGISLHQERENNGLQDKKFVSIKNQEKQRYPPRIYVVQLKLLSFTQIRTFQRKRGSLKYRTNFSDQIHINSHSPSQSRSRLGLIKRCQKSTFRNFKA